LHKVRLTVSFAVAGSLLAAVSTTQKCVYPKAPKGVKPYAWSFFIDSCARRGQTAALAMLPDGKLRKSYQKALDAAHASFWRPDKIWETWPDALLNSGIVQK
jgi:hypothetical protein